LYTFEPNIKAQKFYESKGFRVIEKGYEAVWKMNDIKYQWKCSDKEISSTLRTHRHVLDFEYSVSTTRIFPAI